MSSHRTARTIALSALVGLFALSGCSFHYSSGSSSSRVANGGNGGKPTRHSSSGHSHSGGKPTQNRSSSSSGSGKPTKKKAADAIPDLDDDVSKADGPAEREKPDGSAERTKPAQRTKPAAERTKPTAPTTTTVYENDNDDKIKAKTKKVDPPASNNTFVAPK